jgi:hypothetical protein
MLLNPNDPNYQQQRAASDAAMQANQLAYQNMSPEEKAEKDRQRAMYENIGSIGGALTQTRTDGSTTPLGFDPRQAMTGGEIPRPIGTFNTTMGSPQDDPLFNLRQYNAQNNPSGQSQGIGGSQGFNQAMSQAFGQGANGYAGAGSSPGYSDVGGGASAGGGAGGGGMGGGAVFPLQGNYGIIKMAAGGAVGQMQTPDKLQFISGNMYPGSQQDRSQYATPTQMPAGAQAVAIQSEYDAKINPITGEPMASYANGGITNILRYAEGGEIDYNARAQELANDVYSRYGKNQNYDDPLKELDTIAAKDPEAFYRARMNLYGKQMGWQTGQNTGERNEILQKELATLIPGAKAAGLSEEEIGSLVGSGSNVGNAENQRRIAEEASKGKGWVNQNVPGGWTTLAIAAALAAGGAGAAGLLGEGALAAGAGEGALAAGAAEGALGAGALGAEGVASTWGMGPELLAELGLEGSTSGLSGLGASGDVLAGMGIGGAEAASSLPSLKDAYKAYNYGKKGLGVLNTLSGTGGTASRPTGISPVGGGYSGQGINPANITYNPNTYGNTGLGISEGYNPLVTQPLFLSKLSEFKYDQPTEMAVGGIADLGSYSDGGRLLKGPGDGMSDHIPATIGDKQPARLAEGEFVIPADVVSHLGNGSTDAGAKQLYKMMNNIRRARTGNPKQGKQINPAKFTPKG